MKTLRQFPFFSLLLTYSGFVFSQSPGGVSTTNLTSWFKSDNQVYQNTALTTSATNGSVVLAWANNTANPGLASVQKIGGGSIVYNSTDDYFNFNPSLQITNAALSAGVSNYSVIFSATSGTAYYSVSAKDQPGLAYTFTSNGTSSPCGTNRCCTGFRWYGSQVTSVIADYGTGIDNTRAHILGTSSDYSSTNQNDINGNLGVNNPGAFKSMSGGYHYNIFNFPGYNATGRVAENFTFNKSLTANESSRVNSYLAIKYGVTLGVNGTSMDYLNSTSTVIWDQSANSAYAYDIAGISRDDLSTLDQRKSHSVNNTALVFDDIIVVANGTNFASPVAISSDQSSFVWGHNGQPAVHSGWPVLALPTDNGEIIETIFQREWKSQETGTINTITIEVDLSNIPGVGAVAGANDLAHLRLLVDEDGDFTVGATAIAPTSYNNATDIAYFEHDFLPSTGNNMTQNRGFFFTFGSVNYVTTPLPVTLAEFNVTSENCDVRIDWMTATEMNAETFTVQRSSDIVEWKDICTVDAVGISITPSTYYCKDRVNSNEVKYYRLKQIDIDGQVTIFDNVSLNSDCNTFTPFIYPNPNEGTFFLESPESGNISIVDIKGQLLLEQSIERGSNQIDLMNFASGVFFISIILKDNSCQVLRFLKE